jgi:hypothetical protein
MPAGNLSEISALTKEAEPPESRFQAVGAGPRARPETRGFEL